ncbi:hypothetical protein OROGR_017359 [Orobanche gracilis]
MRRRQIQGHRHDGSRPSQVFNPPHHTSPELTSRDKMVFEQGYGSWELNAYAWTYNRNYS